MTWIHFSKLHSKRSQYFVITAVILCTMAVTLVSSNLMGGKQRTVFDELRDNFATEAYIAINGAIAEDEPLHETFEDFVARFRDYSSSRNVDFNLVYLLMYDETLYAKNFLADDVDVVSKYERFSLLSNSSVSFPAEDSVEVHLDDNFYLFAFDDSSVQIRAFFELKIKN
jgi:hypothetical protein